MITLEKLRIYERFKGDDDFFARAASSSEQRVLTDQEWNQIAEILQRLSMEKSVPVAESFRADTSRLITARVGDAATVSRLKELAR